MKWVKVEEGISQEFLGFRIRDTFLGHYNKDCSILGFILGSLNLWKIPGCVGLHRF